MTRPAFRARYPEFASASDALVDAVLAEAAQRVSEDAFGSRYDAAHGLLTAHLLWSSPFGASMRLDGGDQEKSSRYMTEFARLRTEAVASVIVI